MESFKLLKLCVFYYLCSRASRDSEFHNTTDVSHTGRERSAGAVETESHLFSSLLSKVLSSLIYMHVYTSVRII